MVRMYVICIPLAIFYFTSVGILGITCPPPFHWQGLENTQDQPPVEAFLNTPELIRRFGYPVESHEVTTSDGYILTLFRIPSSNKAVVPKVDKEPVLVQHGLLCSSDDWLFVEPESNLPFLLADLGFDVWLGNSRGNVYSQRHVSYHVNSSNYWDFSYHEMGLYDIPAVIDLILTTTGKKKLNYIAHSMGTTMFFIAMDRHRDLQSKVHKMVALSPVAYLSHVKTPMGILSLIPSVAFTHVDHFASSATIYTLVLAITIIFLKMAFNDIINGGRIFYPALKKWLNDFGPVLCWGSVQACVCEDIMFFMVGYDHSQYTNLTSSIVAGHTPNDGSGKTLVHYLQWVRSNEFQEYDYGLLGNVQRYGTAQPPKYNLGVNQVSTFAMYSLNDWLIQPEDAQRTIKELGNVTSMQVDLEQFSHLDFMYATDVKAQVYDHCVDFLLA